MTGPTDNGHLVGSAGVRARIAWLVPRPLEGSGGHRTILQNIAALERAGYECWLYVEDPPRAHGDASEEERLATVRDEFAAYFGFRSDRMRLGFQIDQPPDLIFATAWYTARFAAHAPYRCPKAYFVQDFEAYFMPVNDAYIIAEDSYRLGLHAVTIGRWLTHKLSSEFGCTATWFDFCADGEVYRPDPGVARERAVCAIYQPEKPRRCPGLLVQALTCMRHFRPDIKVYLYGTREKPELPFDHEHLGLVSVRECADLYNRCRAGLCISATNPSRIPFEMMACGLPVVDIHRPNNLHDQPENGVLLAEPRPEELARALITLVEDDNRRSAMSAYAREYMRPRTLEHGYAQFVAAVEDLLSGRTTGWTDRTHGIEPLYHRGPRLPIAIDPLSGKPVATPPPDDWSERTRLEAEQRLAARAELESILSSRAWRLIDSIKHMGPMRAVARARFGDSWDGIDPREDPRHTLNRIRGSRTYRLIAGVKSAPPYRWVAAAKNDRR
ncbi:MAG: glycosyltransferase family 4 protein [Phycisphaeraceae bacterium]|nr:glycosyltransferase family 4 protein [Phycisphaeraceae bacterium]